MPHGCGQLYYRRHFSLLIGMAVLLAIASRSSTMPGLLGAYALYGAMHASAVALSLRRSQPMRRMLPFIAAAALLSLSAAYLGMRAAPLAALPLGISGPRAVLAGCSIAGALGYGFLIRALRMLEIGGSALALIALACALATGAAFHAGVHSRPLGSVSLAIAWWCAFSGGLWVRDRGRV